MSPAGPSHNDVRKPKPSAASNTCHHPSPAAVSTEWPAHAKPAFCNSANIAIPIVAGD